MPREEPEVAREEPEWKVVTRKKRKRKHSKTRRRSHRADALMIKKKDDALTYADILEKMKVDSEINELCENDTVSCTFERQLAAISFCN